MRKTFFLLISVFLMYQTGTAQPSPSDLTVLKRNTWSFSVQETETLNGLGLEVLEKNDEFLRNGIDIGEISIEIEATPVEFYDPKDRFDQAALNALRQAGHKLS